MKILMLKKKALLVLVCIVFLASFCVVCGIKLVSTRPAYAKVIVIDAGHGGIDGGAEGDLTGVFESELNLRYAKQLEKICKEYGYKVVLTRENMQGLYDETASNKKKSEMQKREKIIKSANPDLVVSLHMNSFRSGDIRGAFVFYAQGSVVGEELAKNVAQVLNRNIPYAHKEAKAGDYYVLNCSSCPSILVECGFLSNGEEEILLQKEEYIHQFCYNLFCGIYSYFK